jgi:hypothetical protein
MPKYRALHSATHDACFVSHSAALMQVEQPPAVWAVPRHGDMVPTSVRMKMVTLTILVWSRSSTVRDRMNLALPTILAVLCRICRFHAVPIMAARMSSLVPQAPRRGQFLLVQCAPREQG